MKPSKHPGDSLQAGKRKARFCFVPEILPPESDALTYQSLFPLTESNGSGRLSVGGVLGKGSEWGAEFAFPGGGAGANTQPRVTERGGCWWERRDLTAEDAGRGRLTLLGLHPPKQTTNQPTTQAGSVQSTRNEPALTEPRSAGTASDSPAASSAPLGPGVAASAGGGRRRVPAARLPPLGSRPSRRRRARCGCFPRGARWVDPQRARGAERAGLRPAEASLGRPPEEPGSPSEPGRCADGRRPDGA